VDFEQLVEQIRNADEQLKSQATKAVNVSLTLRNWLIGLYLHEYEQSGSDRATYGAKVIERVAERLTSEGMERADSRELRRYRQLYLAYPQIREAVTPEFLALLPERIRESATPELHIPAQKLLTHLSFTHLAELIKIDNPVKRTFYEAECIKGGWSVRELKRQVASLYYERSGLSLDKDALSEIAHQGAEADSPALAIRDPYVFEFLGLKPKEVMRESDLEEALLDKLEDFILELGRGFCFEARQRRILIGDEHFFVDLVFYHRILKCHVLIELKVVGFTHEHLGQLNTYVNWFREHEMTEGDNPPVGILLCTDKNQTLIKYALAGMDNDLFVSKYQLALPDEEAMRDFLNDHLDEIEEEPGKN
jgi:predicted nuclease of restriction endonuclease-like (RecB) superfamily